MAFPLQGNVKEKAVAFGRRVQFMQLNIPMHQKQSPQGTVLV